MSIEVPILRMELTGIKYQVMSAVEMRAGEMQMAIEAGIDLAYQVLPALIAQRVSSGIEMAVVNATSEAMREYFGPGGEGYNRIMGEIVSQVAGERINPRVLESRYVVCGKEGEREEEREEGMGKLKRMGLGEALEGRGKPGQYIWRVREGSKWEPKYAWLETPLSPEGWSWLRLREEGE
jgi:hypothetical protein